MVKKFKEGDIVKIRSGGPDMTVKSISNIDGELICQWFSGSKLQSGYFDPESLVKVEEGKPKE